jgi:GDPmannose 4,6-dehydratase
MWLMLRQVEPEDHLICSGQSVSLKAIVSHVFQCLNISLDALHIDASLYRPAEIQDIFGTPDYATSKLGWSSANNAFQTMERILEERLRMQQRHQLLPA